MAIAIKNRAVGRHVVEDTVQNDAHSALPGVLDQIVPVFLGPEVRVNLVVVLGIVAVVGRGIEDRVEVNRRDAERLQVIQILVDPLQVAAHVVSTSRRLSRRAGGSWRWIEAPRACGRRVGVVAAVALGFGIPGEL